MADDATRAIALERLMQRKDEKHKKELDRLHKRIRQLQGELDRAKEHRNEHPGGRPMWPR